MRRILYVGLAVLEFCAAGVLLALVWELPGPADLRDAFGRAERIGQKTEDQVQNLRKELHGFATRQPEMQDLTNQLQKQLKAVTMYLGNQQVDFQSIEAVRDALGDVADGLNGISQLLDPKSVRPLGTALAATAAYLEDKVAPTATRAADQLEASVEVLRVEAENLSAVFRSVSLDPRSLQESMTRLDQFDQALVWLAANSSPPRMQLLKQQLKALDGSVAEMADRVALLAGQTYPSMTFTGFVPTVVQKPIWPDGQSVVQGLRQAAYLLSLGNRYLASLTEGAPSFEQAAKEARNVVFQLRQVLQLAAHQREEWAPVLRNLPENAARLAENLPKLGDGLARLLRDTDRLKDVAGVLRQAQKGIDNMVETWPDLQKKLGRSAVMLRATRKQLNYVLEHRPEYETSLKGVTLLTQTFASNLPVFTSQLQQDLAEQERALGGLQQSIEDAMAVLPHCQTSARRIIQLTRILLALLAGVVSLHAVYLAGRAFAARPRKDSRASAPAQPKECGNGDLAPVVDCR